MPGRRMTADVCLLLGRSVESLPRGPQLNGWELSRLHNPPQLVRLGVAPNCKEACVGPRVRQEVTSISTARASIGGADTVQ
jgi:hypothetical protein